MSHCQEWAACQPPDQMSASQTCFFSTPDFRVGKEAVAFCWLSDSHECQWAGVHCVLEEEEEAGTISQMQISKFVGFCNSQECRRLFFSLLSSLHAMNAAKMKLFGKFLAEASKLSRLTVLNLGSNNLAGTMPDKLLQLSHLETIRLDHNLLGDQFLEGMLPHLDLLDLSMNKFEGPLAFPSNPQSNV